MYLHVCVSLEEVATAVYTL